MSVAGGARGLTRAAPAAWAMAAIASAVPALPGQATAAAPVPCNGQIVREIQVQTRPPYYPPGGKWWTTPVGIVASLHVNTRPDVVRRFVLLRPGDACDPGAVAESERILRSQPFIADASIQTFADPAGGVTLLVRTMDELTPILAVATASHSPYLTALKVGEGNFLGTARNVTVQWADGDLRDTYGARVLDYQFLGRPWHLDASAIRQDAGVSSWLADMSHPFFTDRQRFAWRLMGEDHRDLVDFNRGALDPVTVGVHRRFADVGGIVRIGAPGRLSLFGVSVSHEETESGPPPILDSAISYDSLLDRYAPQRSTRINALWGVRSITYKRARHFDALSAAQDLRVGFQLGTVIGRSITAHGRSDDDLLVAGDLYVGAGGTRSFAFLQATVEGRQDYDANLWDGIIGSGHLTVYNRLSESHTLIGMVDWSGSWKQLIPLQLGLGEGLGGVRGYADSRDAGAMRGVARLEDRWFVGRLRDQADVGFALFADAGRLWAGDAPYGVSTPVKVGLGVGLLGAFPPGSQRTWRVDVAVPVSPDARARWEVRVSVLNANNPYNREPTDVRFARDRVVPSSVFSWP